MNSTRTFLMLVLLFGVWLRLHALVRDVRFQPDEALFSTFARAAAINGDWWLPGALDKPPLAIYANALAVVFVGESEFSARLPGTLASIVLMPAVYAVAKRLYGSSTLALTALILTALSPYAIAFSATALTDGLMLLFMVLAVLMATRSRWGWSGLLLGLAFASKPQAVFYLPLIGLIAWALDGLSLRGLVRFALGLGLCLSVLLIWDTGRGETSVFVMGAANNDPTRLIRANELAPRLALWLQFGGALLGEGWQTALLIGVSVVVLLARVLRGARQPAVVIDLVLLTWLLGYGLLHWLIAFNTYDRYVLPVLPVVVLLVARGLRITIGRSSAAPLHIVFGVFLTIAAVNTSNGWTTINNAGMDYAGIDAVADYLNSKPVATVVYDRWLGWELSYYMGQWTDKRRVYYPTPDALAQGALSLCESGTRYLPAPVGQAVQPYLDALQAAGFGVTPDYAHVNFVVYALTPPASADASGVEASSPDRLGWCVDAAP
jgi:4-amino-4-deoxy-L-arabinose transferase-like glycosyltransferase